MSSQSKTTVSLLAMLVALLSGCATQRAQYLDWVKDNPYRKSDYSVEEERVAKLTDEQLAAEIAEAGAFSFTKMPWVLKKEAAKRADKNTK